MQAASHGAWRGTRHVHTSFSGISPGNAVRSIHTPAYTRFTSPGTAKRIASQARTVLFRLVGHLTAPGLSATPASFQHAIRGSAPGRMSSIQERLSFSARNALARPAQQRFFPRAPTFAPRSITQVGLGTARNFSSGRSVFQNFVENVPITGRALYEADWDVRMQSERDAMKKSLKGKSSKAGPKEMLRAKNVISSISVPDTTPESAPEMDHYFAAPSNPSVTTTLYIPLAPTPTHRVPLPPDISEHSSLLPLPSLASIHNSHEVHSLRVSALFSRLDAANVWERGVLCSAYSERANPGLCNILKVEFVGWTEAEVRSVIGESGTGWCAIEEVSNVKDELEDETFSDASSVLSVISEEESMECSFTVEPAHSLVLPTLDFSSTFVASSPPATLNDDLFSEAESDPWVDSFSDGTWGDNGYLEFSSDFMTRVNTRDQWSSSTSDVSV
ncbi:hypothetical protein GYMLUDRAFT_48643 [Collybiopsis luxurians FD-317 M1]|uniref:Uncharacterized protein n=1 Tax=Collybiopsis luxurians FD-317 M1 TaxID=944289 RepID=A0A0D0BXK0_9AGAR|nr:hypothetical protein GYMLUDRAFT_48643 [Collybiopsis luxurians FD-317 M1]